jgi:hypothetical protein
MTYFDPEIYNKYNLSPNDRAQIGLYENIINNALDILLVISAKPQLPVKQASKHKGAAFCLAIATNGGQILHRVSIQKFYYFFHYKYLQAIVCFVMLLL